ncbi:MAG: MarR family transcriptional regulator [Solirubrobacteraceae bacterium]|jgi:DNA-binding MarR family transcriptional regulator
MQENEAGRPPLDEAWGLIYRLMAPQRLRFLEVAAELGLHPAQAGALMHLDVEQPPPMNELAAMLHCDSSNITGIIDRLEQRGLVERRPSEHDRRVKHLVLTPLGVQTRDDVRRRISEPPEALRQMPLADQIALRDILRRNVLPAFHNRAQHRPASTQAPVFPAISAQTHSRVEG